MTTIIDEMMTRCRTQKPIEEDEDFWQLPHFASLNCEQFLAARLRQEEAVDLLRKVRHNLQVVADEEGVTGPVTETAQLIALRGQVNEQLEFDPGGAKAGARARVSAPTGRQAP